MNVLELVKSIRKCIWVKKENHAPPIPPTTLPPPPPAFLAQPPLPTFGGSRGQTIFDNNTVTVAKQGSRHESQFPCQRTAGPLHPLSLPRRQWQYSALTLAHARDYKARNSHRLEVCPCTKARKTLPCLATESTIYHFYKSITNHNP